MLRMINAANACRLQTEALGCAHVWFPHRV